MPGSSLWREPALQAGPAGMRAASSSSSSSFTAAAGQRYLQGPSEVTIGTGGVPAHTGSSTQTAGQAKAPAVSTRCSKTTFGFNPSGNRITEGKAQRTNTRMCAHTVFPHPPAQPSSTGSHGSFLSSLDDGAETCFASTAAFALPASSRQQGSASAPQP